MGVGSAAEGGGGFINLSGGVCAREEARFWPHITMTESFITPRYNSSNDPYFFGELVCVLYACIFRHVNFQSKKNSPCSQVHTRLRYKEGIFHRERELLSKSNLCDFIRMP